MPTWSGFPFDVGGGPCWASAVPTPAKAIHPPVIAANQCRVRISRSLTMNAVNSGTKLNCVSAPTSPFSLLVSTTTTQWAQLSALSGTIGAWTGQTVPKIRVVTRIPRFPTDVSLRSSKHRQNRPPEPANRSGLCQPTDAALQARECFHRPAGNFPVWR